MRNLPIIIITILQVSLILSQSTNLLSQKLQPFIRNSRRLQLFSPDSQAVLAQGNILYFKPSKPRYQDPLAYQKENAKAAALKQKHTQQINRKRCQKMLAGAKTFTAGNPLNEYALKTQEWCLQCKKGYILLNNGFCFPLDPFCEIRDSNNKCTKCSLGSKLNKNKSCVPDYDQCTKYVSDNPQFCLKCKEGYTPTNKGCAPSSKVCQQYEAGKGCHNCAQQYVYGRQYQCITKSQQTCLAFNGNLCAYCKQPELFDLKEGQCYLKASVLKKYKDSI